MKLKHPAHPAHRRRLLRSVLKAGIEQPSHKALGHLMSGYKPDGIKPSTGARQAPRAHLVREKSGSNAIMNRLDSSIDHMIATALVKGPATSGVMSSLFGLTPNLTGR